MLGVWLLRSWVNGKRVCRPEERKGMYGVRYGEGMGRGHGERRHGERVHGEREGEADDG